MSAVCGNNKELNFQTKEEALLLFERAVEQQLHIALPDFLRKLEEHEFEGKDAPDISRLLALMPDSLKDQYCR
ncbi:MAG: hypothetical protein AB7W16_23625 [Candidatus Obscuribacterales bacterium]